MEAGKVAVIMFIFLMLLGAAFPALAYLPYLEESKTNVAITRPETSQTHYGWLDGRSAVYTISSVRPFKLYLNLMSPRTNDSWLDFSADIYRDGQLIHTMNGIDFVWLVQYEPFANDYYIRGPEYETDAPAGDYRIEIYNSTDRGDYVLAVGKVEDRSLGEFLRTMLVLPEVKEKFFGKNRWEAYQGFGGIALLVLIVVILVILFLAVSSFRRRRLKKRLDDEADEYKKNRGRRGKNYIDLSEVQRLFGDRP